MFANLSVKWKMLAIALAGPVLVAVVMAVLQVMDIKSSSEQAIVEKSRAIVLMAEAGRNEMSRKLQAGIIKPLEELPKDKVVDAVPVITAIRMAEINAKEAGYEFRVPKEYPRNPKNAPDAFERKILQEFETKGLKEKIVVEEDAVRYFRPIRLTRECLFCHGDPKGEADVTGGTKEGWKEGEVHGAFEIISSLDEAKARTTRAELTLAGWTLGILALVFGAAWFLLNGAIIHPLFAIRDYAGAVAGGDLAAQPKGTFRAELATVKGAIETMVGNLKVKMTEAEEKSVEASSQARRAEEAMVQAREQESKATALLERMTRVAREALDIASLVASAAEELSAQVEEVSRGAEIQNDRSGETATAMEEMNATVLEVARNSSSAAESADHARVKAEEGAGIVERSVGAIKTVAERAELLKGEMAALGEKAEGINHILDVISDIADQTNLLALNAAIEAARAGEAGRGFAVVADEVRKLAEKTMQATKEVGSAIQAIQEGTRSSIRGMEAASRATDEATDLSGKSGMALREIVQHVNGTSDQVRSIATAAEEQSAASEEINRAIEDISRITAETSDGMVQAAKAVAELAELAQKLRALIDEMTS